MTRVSAVVPNRNGAALVGRCVEAALAGGVDEVVVVDDGSTDDSLEEARAAGATVLTSAGRGFSAAVNTGVAASSGDLLLILNSDCYVEPDAVPRLAAALAGDPRLGAGAAALHDEGGEPAKSHGHELTLWRAVRAAASVASSSPPAAGSGVQRVSFAPLACMLVSRGVWDAIGGLDERYPFYFEDYDFCRRLRRTGRELAVDWDARALHVGGGSSQQRDPQRWFRQFHESRALYLRKHYPRGWPLYAAVWVPSAAAHALLWLARRQPQSRLWARAYAQSAFAGLRG
jgi:GT2 family glycosyltransferase